MPNIKSAKKRVLVSKANYEHNKAYRSALRTAVKKADAAIDAKSADMAEVVNAAVKKKANLTRHTFLQDLLLKISKKTIENDNKQEYNNL